MKTAKQLALLLESLARADDGSPVTVRPLTTLPGALQKAAKLAKGNAKKQPLFPPPYTPPWLRKNKPSREQTSAKLARQLYGDRAAQVLRDQLVTLSPGDYSPAAVRAWEKVLRTLEREDTEKAKAKA